MNTLRKHFIQLTLWILLYVGAGWLIGALTSDSVNSWYQQLAKASLNPPPLAFPIVWTALYIMIAIAGWSLWQTATPKRKSLVCGLFILQTIMNWMWSFIFFEAHMLGLAFAWIVALIIVVAILILLSWSLSRRSALLLIPYLLWISFASYLSGSVWVLNTP